MGGSVNADMDATEPVGAPDLGMPVLSPSVLPVPKPPVPPTTDDLLRAFVAQLITGGAGGGYEPDVFSVAFAKYSQDVFAYVIAMHPGMWPGTPGQVLASGADTTARAVGPLRFDHAADVNPACERLPGA